jgi:hypothetical protein
MHVKRCKRHPTDKIPPLKAGQGFMFGSLFRGSNNARYFIGMSHDKKSGFIKDARTAKTVIRFPVNNVRETVLVMQEDAPRLLAKAAKCKDRRLRTDP